MSEGGGLVALDKEVAGPGEAIAYDREQQREPWMASGERGDHGSESDEGSAAVENAISRMAMRAQVEGEKLVVVAEFGRAHKCGLCIDSFVFRRPTFGDNVRPNE